MITHFPNSSVKLPILGAGNQNALILEFAKSGYKSWMEYDNVSSEHDSSAPKTYVCFEACVEKNVAKLELVFGEGDALKALAMSGHKVWVDIDSGINVLNIEVDKKNVHEI